MANQTQNLAAILSNFDTALKATKTAYESMGSAARQNAVYQESLQAKTNDVKKAFQDFSNNVISKEMVSGILTLAEKGIGVLDTEIGRLVTTLTLANGVALGFTTIWGQIGTKIVAGSKLVQFFSLLTHDVLNAKDALAAFNLTLGASPLFWITAGSVAAYGIVKLIDAVTVSTEEAAENVSSLNDQISQLTAEGGEYDKLIKKGDDLTKIEKARLDYLNSQLATMERQLKVANIDWANTFLKSDTRGILGAGSLSNSVFIYEELNKGLKDYQNNLVNASVSQEDNYNSLLDVLGKNKEYYESLKRIQEVYREFPNEIEGFDKSYLNVIQTYEKLIILEQKYRERIEETTKANENYIGELRELPKTIDEAKNAYDAFNDAQKEFLQYGGLTQKSIDALEQALPNVSQYLFDNSGNLTEMGKAALSASDGVNKLVGAVYELKKVALREEIAGLKETFEASSQYADYATRQLDAEIFRKEKQLKSIEDEEKALLNVLSGFKSSTNVGGSSKKSDETDLQLEAYKAELNLLKAQYDLLEAQGANSEALIEKYKKIQNALHEQAEYLRTTPKYLKQDAQTLTDVAELSTEWWNIQNKINELLKDNTEELDDYEDKLKEVIQSQINYNKELVSTYQNLFGYITDEIDKEIEGLEKQKEQLNDQNTELEKQIELEQKLADLAEAKDKKKYVYRNGKFEYVSDVDAISTAQKALDDFYAKQAHDDAIAQLDAQIKQLQEQKKYINDAVTQVSLDKKLDEIAQKLGINFDNGWRSLYENIDGYLDDYAVAFDNVEKYTDELEKIAKASADIDYSALWLQAKAAGASQETLDAIHQAKVRQMATLGYDESYYDPRTGTWDISRSTNTASNTSSSSVGNAPIISTTERTGRTVQVGADGKAPAGTQIGDVVHTAGGDYLVVADPTDPRGFRGQKLATGTTSAEGGISLVGEKGAELRVLNQGDGIIPSEITRNLWGFGKDPSTFIKNFGGSRSNVSLNISNVTLPNVSDAQSLVAGLKNIAYQYASRR